MEQQQFQQASDGNLTQQSTDQSEVQSLHSARKPKPSVLLPFQPDKRASELREHLRRALVVRLVCKRC